MTSPSFNLPNSYLLDNNFVKEFMDKLSVKDKNVIGSAIPYMSAVMGDWLLNPSSVSITTFQKMAYSDPIIGSCLEYNMAVISNSIGEYYHDDEEKQTYVRDAFKKLKGGKQKLVRKLLSSMWSGFYVGEKVLATDNDGVYFSEVLSTPPLTIIFNVDAEGRIKDFGGISQYVLNAFNAGYANSYGFGGIGPGGGGTGQPDAFAREGDMDYPYRILALNPVGLVPFPTNKVIYYALEGVDGLDNPYGRSMMRRIYSYYVLKYAMLQFMAFAFDKKAFPLTVLFTDVQQSMTINFPDGTTQNVNAFTAGQQAMANLRGDMCVVLPGMQGQVYDIKTIDVTGDLDIFINAIKLFNEEIRQGLLIPESMFSSTTGGSYALGTSQSSVHNKLLSSMRQSAIQALEDQFVAPLLEINFGKSTDIGRIEENLFNLDDLQKLSTIYESLKATGIVSTMLSSDLNQMREQFKFAEVSEEDITKYFKEPEEEVSTNQEDKKPHYKKRKEVL